MVAIFDDPISSGLYFNPIQVRSANIIRISQDYNTVFLKELSCYSWCVETQSKKQQFLM